MILMFPQSETRYWENYNNLKIFHIRVPNHAITSSHLFISPFSIIDFHLRLSVVNTKLDNPNYWLLIGLRHHLQPGLN